MERYTHMSRFSPSSLKICILVFALGLVTATCFAQTGNQSNAPTGATPTASAPEADADTDSPDIPPIARDRITEEEYFRLRDRQLGIKRGVDDLVRNPQARSRAIRTMQLREQFIRQQLKSTAAPLVLVSATPSWTPLGPDPI